MCFSCSHRGVHWTGPSGWKGCCCLQVARRDCIELSAVVYQGGLCIKYQSLMLDMFGHGIKL
jgi:hypothetical protein